MMRRRDFLRGNWRAVFPFAAGERATAADEAEEGVLALPPDFTPELLRLEGRRLGLPVDSMSKEALVYAVAQAMRIGTRASAATGNP